MSVTTTCRRRCCFTRANYSSPQPTWIWCCPWLAHRARSAAPAWTAIPVGCRRWVGLFSSTLKRDGRMHTRESSRVMANLFRRFFRRARLSSPPATARLPEDGASASVPFAHVPHTASGHFLLHFYAAVHRFLN